MAEETDPGQDEEEEGRVMSGNRSTYAEGERSKGVHMAACHIQEEREKRLFLSALPGVNECATRNVKRYKERVITCYWHTCAPVRH